MSLKFCLYSFSLAFLITSAAAIYLDDFNMDAGADNLYPLVGSDLRLYCYCHDKTNKGPLDLTFLTADEHELPSSDHIIYKKEYFEKNDTTLVTALIKNLTLDDGKKYGIKKCRYDKRFSSHVINFFIIPENSVPNITVNKDKLTAELSSSLTMSCKISVVLGDPVKAMNLVWRYGTNTGQLPNDTDVSLDTNIVEYPDNKISYAHSSLNISYVRGYHGRKYFCVAELPLTTGGRIARFNKIVTLMAVKKSVATNVGTSLHIPMLNFGELPTCIQGGDNQNFIALLSFPILYFILFLRVDFKMTIFLEGVLVIVLQEMVMVMKRQVFQKWIFPTTMLTKMNHYEMTSVSAAGDETPKKTVRTGGGPTSPPVVSHSTGEGVRARVTSEDEENTA